MNLLIASILSKTLQNRTFSRFATSFRRQKPLQKTKSGRMGKEKFRQFFNHHSILPNGIQNDADAKVFSQELLPGERKLLFDALRKITADQYNEHKKLVDVTIHHDDMIKVWYINFVPMFVYGVLDETFLIIGGESINHIFSVYNGMSMLASAAIANIMCNIFLQLPADRCADFLGIQKPVLTVDQMNTPEFRYATVFAKLCGLWCGLTLGLLPLFFIDDNMDNRSSSVQELEIPKLVDWLDGHEIEASPDIWDYLSNRLE